MNLRSLAIIVSCLVLLALSTHWLVSNLSSVEYSSQNWRPDVQRWALDNSLSAFPGHPLIPKQMPGPLDTWAGGVKKEVKIYNPYKQDVDVAISFGDRHEAAPPKIAIFYGKKLLAKHELPKGSGHGTVKSKEASEPVIIKFKLNHESSDTVNWLRVKTLSGSWVDLKSISLKPAHAKSLIYLVAFIWLASIIGIAHALSQQILYPVIEFIRNINLELEFSRVILTVSLIFGLLVLVLPDGSNGIFNGAPLEHPTELMLTAILIPFLLLINLRFLGDKRTAAWLGAALIVKTGLFLFPIERGMNVWMFDNPRQVNENEWKRTYSTIVRSGVSEIVNKPLNGVNEFPLEWLNTRPMEEGDGPDWILMKVETYVDLATDSALSIAATAVIEHNLIAEYENGDEAPVPVVSSAGLAVKQYENAPKGKFKLRGSITFGRTQYREYMSFIPVLIDKDRVARDPFVADHFYTNPHPSQLDYWLQKSLSWILIGLVLLYLFSWIISTMREGSMAKLLPYLTFGIVGACMSIYIQFQVISNYYQVTPLSALLTALAILSMVVIWRNHMEGEGLEKNLFKSVIIVSAPAIFVFYGMEWWAEVGQMRLLSGTDDWHTYQDYARYVFVYGDYLSLHEGIYKYMPFYRYIVGAIHLIFGQTLLAQDFWDLWCVVLSAALLGVVALRFSIYPILAVLCAYLFLFNSFTSNFQWLYNKGLQEVSALLLMMLAMWFVTGRMKISNAVLAGLFSMISFLTRFDHLGPLICLGLLSLKRINGDLKKAWSSLILQVWNNKLWMLVFTTIVVLGPLMIGTRNYFVDGIFCLDDPSDLSQITCYTLPCIFRNIAVVLFAAPPGEISLAAVTLISGTLIGLLALVFRKGFLKGYPPSLGLIILSIFPPYFMFEPFGYAPRFSLHLLPFACLSLMVIIDAILKRNKYKAGSGI